MFLSLDPPLSKLQPLRSVARVLLANACISRVFSAHPSISTRARVHSRSLDYLLCPGSYSTGCVSYPILPFATPLSLLFQIRMAIYIPGYYLEGQGSGPCLRLYRYLINLANYRPFAKIPRLVRLFLSRLRNLLGVG